MSECPKCHRKPEGCGCIPDKPDTAISLLRDFLDSVDEPPRRDEEESMYVREYRHEIYPKLDRIYKALNAKSDIVAISRKCAIEAADYTRLMILAIKHCPKEHQDWADVLRLTEHLETRIAASKGAE